MTAMKKRGYIFAYFLIMILFILWLSESTEIIAHFNSANVLAPADLSQFPQKDPVYFDLTIILSDESITENIELGGWGFVETMLPDTNRYTSIILQDDKHCYEIKTQIYSWLQVKTDRPELKIASDMVGFRVNVSVLTVPDGCYKLYIYCWENEMNYGLADLGYRLLKDDDKVSIEEWNAELIDNIAANSKNNNFSSIDHLSLSDNLVNIGGVAMIDGMGCAEQSVYVEFTDECGNKLTWTTMSAYRKDIKDWKGDEYAFSGYISLIPADVLSDGTYTVKIIVEKEGVIQESFPYVVEKHNDIIYKKE